MSSMIDEAIQRLLRFVCACDECMERNHTFSVSASKIAVENAVHCIACSVKVANAIREFDKQVNS